MCEQLHTSHVTRHTLHVTRHTSHVTRHTFKHVYRVGLRFLLLCSGLSLGFRVKGLGIGVWGLWFGVWGLGFRV